jgi:hypothetical protein
VRHENQTPANLADPADIRRLHHGFGADNGFAADNGFVAETPRDEFDTSKWIGRVQRCLYQPEPDSTSTAVTSSTASGAIQRRTR